MNTCRDNFYLLSPVKEVLKGHQHFFAHISTNKPPETLEEHSILVAAYADRLIKEHQITGIIEQLIDKVLESNNLQNGQGVKTLMKSAFFGTILYHDLGKVNPNFQYQRMGNTHGTQLKGYAFQPSSGHSLPGAFLFMRIFIDRITTTDWPLPDKCKLISICMGFAYLISAHHSSWLKHGFGQSYLKQFKDFYPDLSSFYSYMDLDIPAEMIGNAIQNIDVIQSNYFKQADFSYFALLKLCSSLLTASDYLATHEYMNDAPTIDFGVWNDRSRIKELIQNLQAYKHNARIFEQVDSMVMQHPTEISNKNLNRLRSEMAVEMIRTLRKNREQRLFYLEAPTGGGKTNLSMIAISELMEMHEDINKVFYVFPFTTLITQTCKSLRESFQLNENELGELHSKSPLASNQMEGDYGNEYKDYIDRLFGNYPLSVMSHVRFFDILKGNDKESNYLLHRMANSIVVIDELQSYTPQIWDRILYLVSEYGRLFNIRFILMSATLPRIDKLKIDLPSFEPFIDLLPNSAAYLKNPNFAGRVKFCFELLNNEAAIEMDDLITAVIDKSYEYKQISKYQSVHTIVEFIYKKSATTFYEEIQNRSHPFDYIFVLSGTVLDVCRKDIVAFLKNPANRQYNILLLTTQVVEAGVDIDMDLGFKNVSLIDSDEQLGGRVNRNADKGEAQVYLFRMDNAETLYQDDLRYRVMREDISKEDHEQILREKDFGRLYEKVLVKKDRINRSTQIKNIQSEFIDKGIRQLNFEQVNQEMQLIKSSNTTIFVPLHLPIRSKMSGEEVFSKSELEFLSQFGIYPTDDTVSGEEVWELYLSLITKRSKTFNLTETINFKAFSRIMSKYTFSLFTYSKDMQNLLGGMGKEEYGYFYFSHWDDRTNGIPPYTLEGGLNSDPLKMSNFI